MAYVEDEELQDLRRKRVRELQGMATVGVPGGTPSVGTLAQQAELERREAERAEILRRLFTPEARERLGRIRLAKPEVAQAVEQQVLSIAAMGRLGRPVDDVTLRALLEKIQGGRREIRITRR